ncbi:nickel ABC transporter, nickel/metallophore periplasmic binding protein [Citrobacter sedlakii]|uniref:nickel ABC transporter substrate-binding protein n=1 Tax=Citrobacter TaxID=544 RepID=UPI000741D55D|nr:MULTISPECIES: nickel ABC transporter substrate-binding protein [Citrobacter]KSY28805.1 nickel ABC transporter substrate-binding protein [Citrobacter sp. 50677481]MBJ9889310.1 nickel ABC transporter, nickel/metallophore periplasmic binding protein [Citrobacter sedlakii]MBM9568205.1 nickel ABC transporter, nickel/metallophore periplasmic binding protein [Citrobacter sedlakii]MCK8143639.1 nickel ABC transporter substrate-binding protein [Citrobacter sedlakii]HBL4691448.1 nickel ABC transporter
MLSRLRRTLFALLACASFFAHAAAPDEITTAWPVNVGPLNPHLYTPNQMFAQSMVYEPLVKYQADGSVKPWLAKSWTHTADGKTWTFTLRDDVTFSNGEPFDAPAAAENFRVVLDNRQRHAWLELANQIVDVKALGKTELQITLKSAYYPFLQELSLPRPFRFIAPSQFKDNETLRGIKAPIGTGPWVLKESKLNQYDVLVRNERYWGDKPPIRQITVKVIPDPTTRAVAFETGEVDLLYGNEGLLPLDTFARFSQNPAYRTQLSQPIETVMLALNSAKAPTNELAVREALNYAVNKKSLIDNALYGTQQVADTLFAPSVPYANIGLTPRQYDPQQAKTLLENAGWKLPAGKDIREKMGQPLRIELSFIGTDALSKSMAEIIQADMRKIGVDIALIGEEESSIYARQRDGRFGMIFNRTWGAPYDPHAFMSSMRVPSHADYQAQQGLADKPIIDKEIGEVLETTDETTRQALYKDILTRLHNDAVYLPISYVSMMVVAKPELGEIPYAPIASDIPFEQIKPVNP